MAMSDNSDDIMDSAGPYSMLAVSALENHLKAVEIAGKKYAAIQWEGGTSLTQVMIFCRGLLGYDSKQKVILRDMMGGGTAVEPGDWIVMLSRTAFVVMRLHESASLFALMPETRLSTAEERLSRIAQAHSKNELAGGGTTGDCDECGYHWPCPTYVWATSDRDPLATWDPKDDEVGDCG